jgi:hypothetical protein
MTDVHDRDVARSRGRQHAGDPFDHRLAIADVGQDARLGVVDQDRRAIRPAHLRDAVRDLHAVRALHPPSLS